MTASAPPDTALVDLLDRMGPPLDPAAYDWTGAARPPGVGLRSREDADRLMRGLFLPEPEAARHIDAAIGAIPGLRGMDLISGCLRAA